jgi:Rod binding domain-containing protein
MADFATGFSGATSAALDAMSARQPANPNNPNNPDDKIAGAARDFEALLLGQILKTVHEGGGWLGTGDDDAGEAAVGLGEEQLAKTMAASGGLGLSKLIAAGLRNEKSAANSTPAD